MNIRHILSQYWGYSSFRPMQEEIITSVLNGKDTLALLPTGGGKSICFQVPAMAKEGLCLVISPLIALMKDQVEGLRKKGITAFAIYSGMSRKEVINTFEVAGNSNCKFLYVSPERLETGLFREYLPALNINLIAVDEAHCISQWGYDFRPPYLRIAALREELPGIPILALTASATPLVQNDICDKLLFQQQNIFRQSFERPNLSFSVFQSDAKINKITEILQKVGGSSIVYCGSRRKTQEISELLNLYGIQADYYHAGLPQEERHKKQENWIKNITRTIVCTNAFGMGIDKPDVRVVVHADIPECPENYYQEAGRAGRDGKKAYAVLLYETSDLDELKTLPEIRFPSLEDIRTVYQALMNYLQIPSESGEETYYDFDLKDFLKKFRLNVQQVVYAIRALAQEGWLSFNEQVFLPSRVGFITGKEWLYEFENNNPLLEPLIKALLRTYEGIFDLQVSIHEKTLAFLLKKTESEIIHGLRQLQANHIIEYTPVIDSPQLYLMRNRVKTAYLQIKTVEYQKRKQLLIDRINTQINYVQNTTGCRSQFLAVYFGDNNTRPCGICDNCLQQKNKELTPAEFENIHQQLINILQQQPVRNTEILQHFGHINQQKLWQVLNFLQAENKIQIDAGGILSIIQ